VISFPVVVKRGSASVKICKTPCRGTDRFTISFWVDGVRKRQTFDNLDAAKTEAAAVANRLTSGDLDVLTLTSADRAAYLRARQLLDPLGIGIEAGAAQLADAVKKLGGVTVAQAVEFYKRRHDGTSATREVAEVVEELLASKRADKLSVRYVKQLQYDLNRVAAQFPGRIGDVSGQQVDNWLRGLGVAPRTRNNLRCSLGTLFAFAKGRKYLAKDNDELDAVPFAKDNDGAIEIFTPDEMAELLAAAQSAQIPFLAIGAFAGVRHAELQRLDWADVQRDGDLIQIRAANAKTASRRVIPILPNLKAWLQPHWQPSGPLCQHANMTRQFERLTERVNQARQAAGRADAFVWKHNALRHSFISYRVAQIQNVAQVALEAGNSPQMIFQHYRELVRPADAAKWFALEPQSLAKMAPLPKAAAVIWRT